MIPALRRPDARCQEGICCRHRAAFRFRTSGNLLNRQNVRTSQKAVPQITTRIGIATLQEKFLQLIQDCDYMWILTLQLQAIPLKAEPPPKLVERRASTPVHPRIRPRRAQTPVNPSAIREELSGSSIRALPLDAPNFLLFLRNTIERLPHCRQNSVV